MIEVPHGVMLHHFHDRHHPFGQGAITADEFAEMITHLGPERFLPPEEWCRRAKARTLKAGDLCLTLDDSLKCQFDIAEPVMRAFGLKAFWFVYSGVFKGRAERLEIYRHFRTTRFSCVNAFYSAFFEKLKESLWGDLYLRSIVGFTPREYLSEYSFYTDDDRRFRFVRDRVLGSERYEDVMEAMIAADPEYSIELAIQRLWMTESDLVTLDADGHEIGLHSFSHPTCMSDLEVGEQRRQYRENSAHLQALLGKRPRAMSHPCNSYSGDTLEVLGELGVEIGFRANLTNVGGGLLEMPRDDHSHVMARMALEQVA